MPDLLLTIMHGVFKVLHSMETHMLVREATGVDWQCHFRQSTSGQMWLQQKLPSLSVK